ncbi:hypothetical protein JKJ11_15140 [Vibrio sp. SCSIO 43133]|uniref:hypothetical protein n=1 Tax=Vibrio sp. SCSIO 43133 TaxID=2802577 RepID=UPI002074F056|nr:hypothetical protein [Vibrio sp. SCSIO 43133]USE00241.1 hypothetical protein JKJ11_15140 [Vibrio sp. SCSIO 43133]
MNNIPLQELADIVKIKELPSYKTDDINKYLDHGWVILGRNQSQTGPNDINLSFVLGWSSINGTDHTPPKSQTELDIDAWAHKSEQ